MFVTQSFDKVSSCGAGPSEHTQGSTHDCRFLSGAEANPIGTHETPSVPGDERPRGDIGHDKGTGSNHRPLSYPYVLMERGSSAQDRSPSNHNVSSDLSSIGDDDVLFEDGVVADVCVGHHQGTVPDASCARTYGGTCVDCRAIPDLDPFSKFKEPSPPSSMLSSAPEAGAWVDNESWTGRDEAPKYGPRGDLSRRKK